MTSEIVSAPVAEKLTYAIRIWSYNRFSRISLEVQFPLNSHPIPVIDLNSVLVYSGPANIGSKSDVILIGGRRDLLRSIDREQYRALLE